MKKQLNLNIVDNIPLSELMYIVSKLFNCINFLKEGSYSMKKIYENMISEIKNRLIYKYRHEIGEPVKQVRFDNVKGIFIINKDILSISDIAELYEDDWIKILAETVYIRNNSCKIIDLFPLIILKEQEQKDIIIRAEYYKNNKIYKCVNEKIKVPRIRKKVDFKGQLLKKDYLTVDEVTEIKQKCVVCGTIDNIIFNIINGKVFCLSLLRKTTKEIIENSNPLIPIEKHEVIEFAVPCDWWSKLNRRCMVSLYKIPTIYCDNYFVRLTSQGIKGYDIPLFSEIIDEGTKKKRLVELKQKKDNYELLESSLIKFKSNILHYTNQEYPDKLINLK